jgi:hypothetical protein
MDADETRHLARRHRNDRSEFDKVAFAFVVLCIGGWAFAAYRWSQLVLAANIITVVGWPLLVYMFMNGWFGLSRRRLLGFFRQLVRRSGKG